MSTSIATLAKKLGLKKIDAKQPLSIDITRRDVDKASVKDPQKCAFACAVKREYPDVQAAYFFMSFAWLQYKDKMVRYRLTPRITREIVAFDRNKGMEPGTYTMSPPPKGQRLNDLARAYRKSRKSHARKGPVRGKRIVREKTTNVRNAFAFVPQAA